MWSTLSAGFQMVQEKLDHVLEDPTGQGEPTESPDGTAGSAAPSGDSQVITTDQSEAAEAAPHHSPVEFEQVGLTEAPPISHAPAPAEGGDDAQGEVLALRQALQAAEEQTQLINSEYGRLLREKELEIDKLRTELSSTATAVGGSHSTSHEVLHKELAAHKEMVSELRKQLVEKEEDFKELNTKAETKFNKLKAQAKAKIATLNKDLERLRSEAGETHNVSAQSLDDSVVSVGVSPVAGPVQLEGLRVELTERDKEVATLKQEQLLWQQEKEQELSSMKDKLTVSEVCLQKEQENRVKLELRVTELEEQVDNQSDELSAANTAQNQLQAELDLERERAHDLQAQLGELNSRLESQGELTQRNVSLASSDIQQVIASRADSEEEWRVVPSEGSATPPEKPPESSLPMEVKQLGGSEESPAVLLAGGRASLLDLESEVSRLEAVLRERDEQLSSFKSILEGKEAQLKEQKENEQSLSDEVAQLSTRSVSLEAQVAQGQSDMERLKLQLDEEQAALVVARNQLEVLESEHADLRSSKQSLEASTEQLSQQVEKARGDLEESMKARDSFEQELWSKMSELSNLRSEIELHKAALAEKTEEILQQSSEIERNQQMLQELQASNKALKASLDGDKQESVQNLAKSTEQIRGLEERVAELNAVLQAKELEIQGLSMSKVQVEQHLQATSDKESAVQQRLAELQNALERQKQTSATSEGNLRKELESVAGKLREAVQQRDDVFGHLRQSEADAEELKKQLAKLQSEKETAQKHARQLESEVAKSAGALEFAHQEIESRDTTIKSLSRAVEEKSAALVDLNSSIASMKGENADKMSEMMQRSEQCLQEKAAVESELREAKLQLQSTEELLSKSHTTAQQLEASNSSLSEELQAMRLQFHEQQREQEKATVATETLQGQVQSLSEDKVKLVRTEAQHQQEVSQFQAKVTELSSQVSELQHKLQNAKQQLTNAVKGKQEYQSRVEKFEEDLGRYKRENQQMKEQFDSAVKLMETKATEQASQLSRARQEFAMKEAECISLKEQAVGEGRKSSELKERLGKLTADYKVSADRCRLLEREKMELQQTVASLRADHSQLEQSFSDTLAEKESLSFEHQASLRGVQENEGRVLELTNQIAQLAREKGSMESQVRELTRQHGSSEQRLEQLRAEIAGLKVQAREGENWQREKQALLQDREALEREKTVLQGSEASLQSQLQQLQASQEQLQQALRESNLEMESLQRAAERASATEDLQAKLKQLQASHAQEVARLQRSLQDELGRRQTAERGLVELQGEVAIGMEDLQPVGAPGMEGEPKSLADYVQMAGVLLQRLIKNPNIVLTRLLRATPQTKLLFLAYFLFLHLFILYVVIV